jgi:hypothetical protein
VAVVVAYVVSARLIPPPAPVPEPTKEPVPDTAAAGNAPT